VIAAGWRKVRYEEDSWRPLDGFLGALPGNRALRALGGLVGVFLLGVAIYSGLEGTEAPDRNFITTFVFVTVWLGFPAIAVAFGDVFQLFNPWRALSAPVGWSFRKILGRSPSHLAYPERLGRWPAAVGLVAVVWLELIYGSGNGVAVGVEPAAIARAAIFYSVYTLVMIGLFGREKWFANGEVFSVYFGMYGSLGKLQARDGRLGVRKFMSGSTTWIAGAGSIAVAVASVGTTTFDGAQEGVFSGALETASGWMADIGFGPLASGRLGATFVLGLSVLLVALIFSAGVRGMSSVPGASPRRELARSFGHVLIPIAFAYLVAHYFSLFAFQMQAQFTFLLSDPLGTGTTDLFGTAGSGIDYGLVTPELTWYVQVAALVAGHVAALALAHDRALSIWGDYRSATRSQYWMLAVMVAFTCFGLFLLSVTNA
jgi:hypothetical protein